MIGRVTKFFDTSPAPIQVQQVQNVIFLLETRLGPVLADTNQLIEINSDADYVRLGRNALGTTALDIIKMYRQINPGPVLVGRIGGTGGVVATTTNFVDTKSSSPQPTLKALMRGPGADGNLYSLKIERGSTSTSPAPNTKISLVETATNTVLASIDNVSMDVAAENYAVTKWNALQTLCVLQDMTPADTYTIDDEPAVATIIFAGGTDHAASTSTERAIAANALVNLDAAQRAIVGIHSWDSGSVNLLAANLVEAESLIIDVLADATTPASADRAATVTTNKKLVASYAGWGTTPKNPTKRIPALGQIVAQIAIAQNRKPNSAGARTPYDGWATFDANAFVQDAWRSKRINPVYRLPQNNKYGSGVIVAGTQSLDTATRYAQWVIARGENAIVDDILDFLSNRVLESDNYPVSQKGTDGINSAITLLTLDRVLGQVKEIMRSYEERGVVDGPYGNDANAGWAWRGDVVDTANGVNVIFWLGLSISGLITEIELRVGAVAGRFEATVVATTAQPK